jgi:type IV pilus assembly protein PilA
MKEMVLKRMALQSKDKKGFTLVEVIVVLVILAILMAIAIPALTGYIDKARRDSAVAEAASAKTAVQTIISDAYSHNGVYTLSSGGTLTFTTSNWKTTPKGNEDTVTLAAAAAELTGANYTDITITNAEANQITGMTVTSNGKLATFENGAWTVIDAPEPD